MEQPKSGLDLGKMVKNIVGMEERRPNMSTEVKSIIKEAQNIIDVLNHAETITKGDHFNVMEFVRKVAKLKAVESTDTKGEYEK
jgi:hypothetical protein